MCIRDSTWVVLRERSTGREVLVVNIHLDHKSAEARAEGAKVIRKRIALLAGGRPVILTGDFNDGPDGEAYATYMRDLTTDYLRSHGELPAGVRLGTVDRFMNVATRGEAWIDGDGLPLRMTLTMEHPQARDGTRTTVEVQTDFTGYGLSLIHISEPTRPY